MASQGVKVHGFWASPFSARVELALNLKGVPYEYVAEDNTNKSPELIKYNPVHKKMPVLVHDGKALPESLIIVQYVDETWKETYPILPKDPYQKAVAQFWAMFVDDKLWPAIRKTYLEDSEAGAEETREHLKLLEQQLEGKRFFGGDNVGYLDIAAIIVAYWLEALQDTGGIQVLSREKFPTLCEWADNFVNVAAVKQILPPRDRLVAFSKTLRSAAK